MNTNLQLSRKLFLQTCGAAAVTALLPRVPFAAPAVQPSGAVVPAARPKLRFGVEVLDHDFDQSAVLTTVEENLQRQGIEEVLFWGALNVLNETAPVPEFAKYALPAKPAQVDRLKQWLARYQKHGVRLVADGREPQVQPEFFGAYPQARRVTNGQLWEFLEKRIQAVFRLAPQLDRIESFLWETWLLNNDHYFEQMHWSEDGRGFAGGKHYVPVDYMVEMIAAFARGAQQAGKEYAQKGFSNFPWEERLLVEAMGKVPRAVPLRCSTQMQMGDFNPFMPPPLLVAANQTRPMAMYFDCFGEYLGRSQVPYCYPERIQHRVQWAVQTSAALDTVRARVNFADRWNVAKTQHLFGTPNEINLVALSRLARDPDCSIQDVWQDWASARYGKAAAEAVIRALRRSVGIVRGSMFFHGMKIPRHSQLPTFEYLETNTVPQSLKAAEEWYPERVEEIGLLRELAVAPTEHVLGEMLQGQDDARRLCDESLQDIEAVRKDLSAKRYQELKQQFEFTANFVATYRLIVEAFVRTRMKKHQAPAGNAAAIARALAGVEEKARYAEAHYGPDSIIQGADLRKFIAGANAAHTRSN